ncbi:MAG: DEAD/DEAH box helicase [Bacteroidales bacterium]|nr:DEAD/DEAH box helicase [Bacteroidales bacterium]
MLFEEFGLQEKLLEALSYMGFEKATPIQIKAMPEILAGKDLIACAQTGTGKSAAFLLPVLSRLADRETPTEGINTLIIVPTRELAIQIEQQVQGFAYFVPVSSIAIYGGTDGMSWDQEKKVMTEGAEIVVATPGKLIAHLNMGYVNLSQLEHLILDEADRMLDIGFYEDIMKIVKHVPAKRQTLMFSATMASKIRNLAKTILTEPAEISTAISKPAEGVLQAVYLAHNEQKIPLISNLIGNKSEYTSILIFTSTKKNVNELVRALHRKGENAEGISSDLEQREREEVLARFRARQVRTLVATDVMSRGIDIKDINLIINYDVPQDAEDYVHRVGRTARADKTGVALTLVNEDDMFKFHRIEELIESSVIKLNVPEELGESPVWNPLTGRNFRYKNRNFRSRDNQKGRPKGRPGGKRK